jgi:hypothetical protein
MLSRVWKCDEKRTLSVVEKLAQRGILRFATLQTGAVWCVANASYARALQHLHKNELRSIVEGVLAAYESDKDFTSLSELTDDGFLALHIIGMLGEVGRLQEMRCAPQYRDIMCECTSLLFLLFMVGMCVRRPSRHREQSLRFAMYAQPPRCPQCSLWPSKHPHTLIMRLLPYMPPF